ncbi:MAG: NAD(P)/FAD-dependent oxidoreductase [Armatimonadota bacterium]
MFDLAILGSGFGGSLLAMAARRLGLSVLLLERGTHPRFAIGESSSPLANLLLEELGRRCDLPRLLPLASYGTWKRTYPEVGVGLKRGFTFYHHQAGHPFQPQPERESELLVAASPNDDLADTHWYRPDFDAFLMREAVGLGVEYLDRTEIRRVEPGAEQVRLEGERRGRPVTCEARLVVDASGPRGALFRLLGLPEREIARFPGTQSLFSHFTGVRRWETLVPPGPGTPPYHPDDAALHHVFDGGWIWMLRFENGITSAGIAAEDRLAEELGLAEGEPAWERVLSRLPSVREQFAEAEAVEPFRFMPRIAWGCAPPAHPRLAMLPSALGFVDPLFSTGFPLTLLGIHRLLAGLERGELAADRSDYYRLAEREADAAAALVSGSYAAFPRFPAFAALSMFYFAAASYSEMARRLDRGRLASEFLLQNQPGFREGLLHARDRARGGNPLRLEEVAARVEPWNVAGLCDPSKRSWYPADLADVVHGAAKLEVTADDVHALIARMGW